MVTVQDFSIDNLRNTGRENFRLRLAGTSGQGVEGYPIAQDGIYHLRYVQNVTTYLENGTEIFDGTGFLVSKDLVDRPYEMGIAFYNYREMNYSQIPESEIQVIVNDYNNTIEGDEIQTEEESERLPRRERTEPEESEESEDAVNQPLFDDVVIREEPLILESNFDIGNIREEYNFQIIQITRGNVMNPKVSYKVVQTNSNDGRTIFETTVSNQDEAETIFENRIEMTTQEFNRKANASYEEAFENMTEIEEIDDVDLYYQKTDLSFKEMLSDTTPYEERAFRKFTVFTGNFGDAVKWSNGNNTLELVDFDFPRVTTRGVEENTSGGLRFTVNMGWRVSFTLRTNSLTFTSVSKSKVEGFEDVEVTNNEFDFTMYGGDTLEIDIDNERNGLYPFVITTAGKEWSSAEEIDDEVFITMNSAEKLFFTHTFGTQEIYSNPPRVGQVKSEQLETVNEPVIFNEGYYLSNNLTVNSRVRGLMLENRAFTESLVFERSLDLPEVTAESSFVNPELPSLPDVSSPLGSIWDSARPWIIGGIITLIVVGGIYVYINARARRGE